MSRGMVVILKVVWMKVISMGQFEKGENIYINYEINTKNVLGYGFFFLPL